MDDVDEAVKTMMVMMLIGSIWPTLMRQPNLGCDTDPNSRH
jgi:hypothetical protein